jgi:hypothetical protein
MAIFESEKKRKEEAANLYSQKYPLSDSISSLQNSLNLANVELVGLRMTNLKLQELFVLDKEILLLYLIELCSYKIKLKI